MFLDSKTLLAVFAYTHILQALGLIYVRRIHQNYAPTLFWAIGSCSIALGVTLVVLRDVIPLWLSVLVGQAFIMGGLIVLISGIVMACGRTPPLRAATICYGLYMAGFSWFTLISPDIHVRSLMLVGGLFACNSYSISAILRYPTSPLKPSLLILASLQAIEIAAIIGRNIGLQIIGYDQTFQNNFVEITFALILISTTFLSAFLLATFTSQRLQIELRHAARHDSLTGLYNRRAFAELADREWLRAFRHDETMSMLMIDIDFFKALNDRFGHQVGDQVLESVAATIRNEMRGEDIFCRYGGEEFTAFLVDTDISQAKALGERLRLAVTELHIPEIADFALSISIGAAVRTPEHTSWEDVLTSADIALYQAKQEGRNRVCTYIRGQS